MSKVTRREWYERVNAEWPDEVPPLTFAEAVRAYRRLYRFVYKKPSKLAISKFRETSGNRHTHIPVINPESGWKGLVHHLSHRFCVGGHGGEHARMERRLIKEVKRRGWLDGKLKDKPERDPDVQSLPTIKALTKLDHAQRMLMRAATRAKRATTILKKWQRKVRYYERLAVQP